MPLLRDRLGGFATTGDGLYSLKKILLASKTLFPITAAAILPYRVCFFHLFHPSDQISQSQITLMFLFIYKHIAPTLTSKSCRRRCITSVSIASKSTSLTLLVSRPYSLLPRHHFTLLHTFSPSLPFIKSNLTVPN